MKTIPFCQVNWDENADHLGSDQQDSQTVVSEQNFLACKCNKREYDGSPEITIINGCPVSQQIWHAKEPSLLNGHKCRAQVKICSPLPVIVTSPYATNEWLSSTACISILRKKKSPLNFVHVCAIKTNVFASQTSGSYTLIYIYPQDESTRIGGSHYVDEA